MSILLFCAPAPVLDAGSEAAPAYRLDVKFVEGMRAHVAAWGGPVRVILWRGDGSIPFGATYLAADLGFELIVLDRGAPVPQHAFDGAATAMVSLDQSGFDTTASTAASAGVPIVVSLEYTLETRLRIVWLDSQTGVLRKLRRSLWQLRHERRLRQAMAGATGVQFNGYPAHDAYAHLTDAPLMYLDGRMTPELMATPSEMAAKADHLRRGAPLRLVHSGRLEPMKGAQDVLRVMDALAAAEIPATLDIFGSGSLEGQIRDGLARFDGKVRLHAPVDFETQLVPFSRTQADIFLSCHRQSDPSCSYIEAMGCGLAVAGYANRMWARLCAVSGAGATVPLGDPAALAQAIAAWDRDREALITATEAGLAFATAHDFPTEFARRIDHLRACAR